MDHNIENIRLHSLETADQKVTYLYDAFTVSGTAHTLFVKYSLDEAKWSVFILTIGDIILGFYQTEDTVPLLQQELGIDAATAEKLGAEVLAFLAPLQDPNWQPPVEETDEVAGSSTPAAATHRLNISESSDESPAVKRVPIKSSVFAVPQPIHTFAHDMEVMRHAPDTEPVEEEIPRSNNSAPIPEPTPIVQTAPQIPTFINTSTPVVPTSQSEQGSVPLVHEPLPATKTPLEPLPSYTPPAIPVVPVPTASTPAPDRPRWSTDI